MSATKNAIKVAIVGSGPSGFYAAEALLQSSRCSEIDIIERLPVPFGLVRYGVAPDHQKLKSVDRVFSKIAVDPRVTFFGNVAVGYDVSVRQLVDLYDAVVVACGADADRKMNIPGETLQGSYAASDFVSWYNGHPDAHDHSFDLSKETVAIVGHGNVAIDLCRILATSIADLHKTDIARHALHALKKSRVKKIHLVGRRGPAQMKFTPKELHELGLLEGWDIVVDPSYFEFDQSSLKELSDSRSGGNLRNVEILQELSVRPRTSERLIEFSFLASPARLHGDVCVESLIVDEMKLVGEPFELVAARTGRVRSIEAGIVFRSVGYLGRPIPGLPFAEASGTIPNISGQVVDENGDAIAGLYVTGWVKRGPTGVIGTNRADSIETVERLLQDCLPRICDGRAGLQQLLTTKGVRVCLFHHWQLIDEEERRRGIADGRVREKFTTEAGLLSIAHGSTNQPKPSALG
jgi:ferredoxin/flavodoxin---NADP+ reductase